MEVKQEVKELCLKLRQSTTGSKEWHEIKDELQSKWRMSSWAIVSLYMNPPVIEVEAENHHLMVK